MVRLLVALGFFKLMRSWGLLAQIESIRIELNKIDIIISLLVCVSLAEYFFLALFKVFQKTAGHTVLLSGYQVSKRFLMFLSSIVLIIHCLA